MYKKNKMLRTSIVLNQSVEGETIEQKIERIKTSKEPIKDGAPLQFTERKDGVVPAYNIRTDKNELAIEATDKLTKTELQRRADLLKANSEKEKGATKEDGQAESIQGQANERENPSQTT